jgi:heme/copper-type cytochrome/quinol oxidase subunit 2
MGNNLETTETTLQASSEQLSTGIIALIAVLVVLVIVTVIGILLYFLFRRKKQPEGGDMDEVSL